MNEEWRKYLVPFLLTIVLSLGTGALLLHGKVTANTVKIGTLEDVIHEIKMDVKEILKELRRRKF